MIRLQLLLVAIGLCFQATAQSTIQEVLHVVEKNNPQLKAAQNFTKARELGIRSTNTLANPEVEWEKSFSSEEGKPYEFTISQSFDFPTSYMYRKQLNKQRAAQLEKEYAVTRQNLLFDTQLVCLELIFRWKQEEELSRRQRNAERLNQFFEKRLKTGDANILEVNKIKMLLLNTVNQLQVVRNQIIGLQKDLTVLNGGIPLRAEIKEYPPIIMDQNLQLLVENALANDLHLQSLNLAEQSATKETALVKTNSLPKFNIGYRYLNSDLSKQVNGMKLGLSIPLWENKHKVKEAKLVQQFRKDELLIAKMTRENELRKLIHTRTQLQKSLENYQQVFSEKKYNTLLTKALEFGEISGIEYLMESVYFYESYDTFLQLEYEYFKTTAIILKFRL